MNGIDASNDAKEGLVANNAVGEKNGQSNGENKKIFVGGIAYEVTNDDLQTHFAQFGEVTNAQVKYDRLTGRSRGFAFVEFATTEACRAALASREQTIMNKQVEVKPAKSRENKKVFVGGLPSDYSEEELRSHFEAFGRVEDIEWPFDKASKQRRNFAFVVFEEEEAANKAASQPKQTFGARECDVKKAVPQGRRFQQMPGAPGGVGRGGWTGSPRGAFNGPATNGWAPYNGWGRPMTGMPYGATAAGGWGGQHDWYNYAAAGFYQQPHAGAGATGAHPYTQYHTQANGGYDAYGQQNGGAGGPGAQNGGARNGGAVMHPSNGARLGGYGQQAQQY